MTADRNKLLQEMIFNGWFIAMARVPPLRVKTSLAVMDANRAVLGDGYAEYWFNNAVEAGIVFG